MKNLRKVLALVLAVVMTVSTFTVAFAAEKKTDGQILKALGLIQGNENGDLMEDKTITRAEAARVIVKVMNWDLEAKEAYTFVDNTWAKAEAATLVKHGITNGVGNNKFGGDQVMDQLQVYAWAYKAITGDTANAWENPSLLSAILDADQVVAVAAAKNKPAKRSEIFKGMVTILTTEVEGKTQLDKLIEAGVVTEAAAIELGLKEAPVVENVIKSVELLNYKEAKVVFSVEASDAKGDYKFGDKVVTNVTRSADKKEAIVVLAQTLKAQDLVTFNYKKDGYEFEKKDLTIIDTTVPTVVDVKTTDKGKLTITFSEAIDGANSTIVVKVDNGMLYASVGAVSDDGRTVVATVSSATDGKEYKLEISGAKDYAGYVMGPKTIEGYKYEAVKAPITVSVKEANQKSIVLSLSAGTNVAWNEDTFAANFSYILGKNPTKAKLSTDKKEVTLDLTGYHAPQGTWTLTIKDADKMFEDTWGNKAAADITLSFTVVIDTTAPTVGVKSWKQADQELVLLFSEEVQPTEAKDKANYKFLGADGKEITDAITGNGTTTDNKEFKFPVNKEKFVSETVTLVVEKDKIKDTSENKLAETKIPLDTKYMRELAATIKAVKSASAESKTSKLYVTFTNNMLAATADASKWAVSTGAIKSVAFDEGSTKVIVITLKEDTTIVGLVVTTTAINDVDGNTLYGKKLSYDFKALETANVISSTTTMTAAALASQTVEFVVTGKVVDGIGTSAFKLDLDGKGVATKTTTVAAVNNVVYSEKDGVQYTTFTLTLPATHKLNAIAKADAEVNVFNGEEIYITATGLVLNSGVVLKDTVIEVKDGIAPTINDDTAKSAATKKVKFATSEELTGNADLFATELVVKYDGKVLVAGNEFEVKVGANFLEVTLKLDKVEKDKEVVISLGKTSNYITDASEAKNKLGAFDKTVKLAD